MEADFTLPHYWNHLMQLLYSCCKSKFSEDKNIEISMF